MTTQYVYVPAKHLRTLTGFALAGAFVVGFQLGRAQQKNKK